MPLSKIPAYAVLLYGSRCKANPLFNVILDSLRNRRLSYLKGAQYTPWLTVYSCQVTWLDAHFMRFTTPIFQDAFFAFPSMWAVCSFIAKGSPNVFIAKHNWRSLYAVTMHYFVYLIQAKVNHPACILLHSYRFTWQQSHTCYTVVTWIIGLGHALPLGIVWMSVFRRSRQCQYTIPHNKMQAAQYAKCANLF